MFTALFTLLPALRMSTLYTVQDAGRGDGYRAIASCVEAVQLYFPCEAQARATNHTCLCEQYLWRVSCFDEHATSTLSDADRETTESEANRYCLAAGTLGVNSIQRKQRLHGRQIGNLLSNIASEVTSILASNDVTVPTAIITSAINGVIQTLEPSASRADVTAIASSIEAAASTAATSSPSGLSRTSTQTSSTATVASAVTSAGNSGPSTGLIAGAAIGGVVALALIGILIILVLRHRKQKASSYSPRDKEASPTLSYNSHHLSRSPTPTTASPFTNSTLASATLAPGTRPTPSHTPSTFAPRTTHQYPQNQHHNPHTDEKVAFHMQPQHPHETEMPTTANVWELDGREMHSPLELESPRLGHAQRRRPVGGGEHDGGVRRKEGEEQQQQVQRQEDLGSPVSPVSPVERVEGTH